MRSNAAWLGIAAMGILQYMGPRPLFVRTAYADEPTPIREVVTGCSQPLRFTDLGASAGRPDLAPEQACGDDAVMIDGCGQLGE